MSFEILTATKDVILIFAAILTANVAVKGLQSWARELKGKADFEVARNLIRSTYKLRDELSYCRSPWIPINEFPQGYDPTRRTPSGEAQAYSYLYTNRWKPVASALQEFETQSLESEALWGSEFKPKTDEMRQCVRNLQVSIDALISNYANDGEDFRSDDAFKKRVKAEVQEINRKENPLSLKINAAIKAIENAIRPHIRKQ
ncbi:MAG: hypothetical protein KKA76_07550 [Proteobacteria bacterium]|nr:hypothetical protein [Pseudomonadota bacterium]